MSKLSCKNCKKYPGCTNRFIVNGELQDFPLMTMLDKYNNCNYYVDKREKIEIALEEILECDEISNFTKQIIERFIYENRGNS